MKEDARRGKSKKKKVAFTQCASRIGPRILQRTYAWHEKMSHPFFFSRKANEKVYGGKERGPRSEWGPNSPNLQVYIIKLCIC